jgi:hypothetical protein
MVRGGGWLWWAYRTYDICTLLSIQYLGVLGGTWGGSRSDYSRHLYILGCAGGGGCRATCLFLVLRLRGRGVFLVLVQNVAARGLVQKPSNYSLSSVRYIEKNTKNTKNLYI